MWGRKQTKYFHLSKSLKKLGKYIGRGKKNSIVSAIMSSPHIVSAVGKDIKSELKDICSDMHSSILRMKYKEALERFSWERVWEELKEKVPTLLNILCSGVSSDKINPAICMSASILIKLHNPKVNLVQAMLSVVLKAGQASIQVLLMSPLSYSW